ncbi:MAG: esterase-like activity of phytase family protein [Campylobacteraceae bacterium]|jgi:hypothetical protein|nr:esterase-like activity of phytase family protein [Campylobacteraceae bacterium]
MLSKKAIFLSLVCCVGLLFGAEEYSSVLSGHALLPAKSFVQAPQDAPQNMQTSGKYSDTTTKRVDKLYSIEGLSSGRPTGVFLPFNGQPLQGHSGIKYMQDKSVWLLSDNGAGSKANSPDFMLFLNRYSVDFTSGKLNRLENVFLHDEDKKVPFHIVNEGSDKRYLTGADFDPESFQIAGGNFWIGEEFGPYLIKADRRGKVLAVFETLVDGKVVRSPDHYALKTPNSPNENVKFEVRRSKGFEGMAISKDGSKLYPMLEGALYDERRKVYENDGGKEFLRILEFDVKAQKWTGRFWRYALEQNGNAIGDFNMISDNRALIIERDNGEGVSEKACYPSQNSRNCFDNIAAFKRVYLVELNPANANAKKIAYIDLLNIKDPDNVSRKPLSGGVFKFPFFTIENVDMVDSRHIIVGNDNNLPFSSSREPNTADDNELILLDVGDFLNAK